MKIDYTALGKRIAKRRKELGLKQYEVCELIDVNYKYLSNIETGRSAPSLELIMSIRSVLNRHPTISCSALLPQNFMTMTSPQR